MQFPREQLRRVPFLARYNGKTLKERRTRVLLLDGNGLSTAPGRIISLAADDLVGTDADIVLLLSQLGHGLGGSLGLDRLSTLEVLLGAILNLITSDGSCLLDGDLSLLALDVGSLGDLGCLDNDLSSGLVLLAQNLAAISAADDQIIGTALLGGSGDYVFLLCCCCSVLASGEQGMGGDNFLFAADLADLDHVIVAVFGAGSLYNRFIVGDRSAEVMSRILGIGVVSVVRNGNFFGDFLGLPITVLILFLGVVNGVVNNGEGSGTSLALVSLDQLGGVFLNGDDSGLIGMVADRALAFNGESTHQRGSVSSVSYKVTIGIVSLNGVFVSVREGGNIELLCVLFSSCVESFVANIVELLTTVIALDVMICFTLFATGSSFDDFVKYFRLAFFALDELMIRNVAGTLNRLGFDDLTTNLANLGVGFLTLGQAGSGVIQQLIITGNLKLIVGQLVVSYARVCKNSTKL